MLVTKSPNQNHSWSMISRPFSVASSSGWFEVPRQLILVGCEYCQANLRSALRPNRHYLLPAPKNHERVLVWYAIKLCYYKHAVDTGVGDGSYAPLSLCTVAQPAMHNSGDLSFASSSGQSTRFECPKPDRPTKRGATNCTTPAQIMHSVYVVY